MAYHSRALRQQHQLASAPRRPASGRSGVAGSLQRLGALLLWFSRFVTPAWWNKLVTPPSAIFLYQDQSQLNWHPHPTQSRLSGDGCLLPLQHSTLSRHARKQRARQRRAVIRLMVPPVCARHLQWYILPRENVGFRFSFCRDHVDRMSGRLRLACYYREAKCKRSRFSLCSHNALGFCRTYLAVVQRM